MTVMTILSLLGHQQLRGQSGRMEERSSMTLLGTEHTWKLPDSQILVLCVCVN